MLQAIHTIHQLSVVHPSLYFGCLLLLALVCLRGWYVLGVSAGPHMVVPVRLGWKFSDSSRALFFTVANLRIVGHLIADGDTLAASIALQVT